MSDEANKVNHPDHYNKHPSGVECIEIVEHMNFNLGNSVKYIWRASLKGDFENDLKKARWYINREIFRLYEEPPEAEEYRMMLADILLSAVVHPDVPTLETIDKAVLDRARMMVDHSDLVAAAERVRGSREDE